MSLLASRLAPRIVAEDGAFRTRMLALAAGMILLKEFVDRVQARGVHVLLCGVRRDLAHRMETTGLSSSIGTPIFYEEKVPLTSTILAIRYANDLIGDPCASCPRRGSGEGSPSLRYVI